MVVRSGSPSAIEPDAPKVTQLMARRRASSSGYCVAAIACATGLMAARPTAPTSVTRRRSGKVGASPVASALATTLSRLITRILR
jgi:hypothetical protein